MRILRTVDRLGNQMDHDTEFVPRIGERIRRESSVGGGPMTVRYFRVKDVVYDLDHTGDKQVAVLIDLDPDQGHWPS